MNPTMPTPPDALLFIAPGCPHCPAVLQGLADLIKEGVIGRLEVINVATHPEQARQLGVRTAPWARIGTIELEGAQTPAELRRWAQLASNDGGTAAYVAELLRNGQLARAETWLAARPEQLAGLLPLLSDTEIPIQVRLGLGALFEGHAGSEALQALVPALGELSRHADHRVRADACHYLGLSADAGAIPHLQKRLGDDHPEVREIAAEALESISG